MAGVAAGQVIAYAMGTIYLYAYLRSSRSRVRLSVRATPLRRDLLRDILKVGALACISPLQTVLTILILTWLVAQFGTTALAGYGIGTRLEFLLIPIAFAIGVASVPLVGMAMGAGKIARARRATWIAAALASALLGATWARGGHRSRPVDPPVHARPGGARFGRRLLPLGGSLLWAVWSGALPLFLVARRRQGRRPGPRRHAEARP